MKIKMHLTNRRTATTPMTNPMEPDMTYKPGWNPRRLSKPTTALQASSLPVSLQDFADDQAIPLFPQVRPDEPNLYDIPQGLHAEYRPLPLAASLLVWLCSGIISAAWTWNLRRLTWIHPLVAIQEGALWQGPVLRFLLRMFAMVLLSRTMLQEIFLAPSRVSMKVLQERFTLPSKLSKYERIPLSLAPSTKGDDTESNLLGTNTTLGVHFLETVQEASGASNYNFDAVYVNHGFGANSLSWLPSLPGLVQTLKACMGLGHDCVGFGFTDRQLALSDDDGIPNDSQTLEPLELYNFTTSSKIGIELLNQKGVLQHTALSKNVSSTGAVALFGHSMGTITTLRMALSLPADMPKFVVLVAPALGLRPSRRAGLRFFFGRTIGKLLTPVWSYGLRRLVGTPNFWRRGLEFCWGDRRRLADSDVLRFQWPSVGEGWERGILNFAAAGAVGEAQSDRELVDELLQNHPKTRLCVVTSDRDPVISSRMVRHFFRHFPEIPIVEMNGTLGHDPFEEDVSGFLQVVQELMDKYWHNQNDDQ